MKKTFTFFICSILSCLISKAQTQDSIHLAVIISGEHISENIKTTFALTIENVYQDKCPAVRVYERKMFGKKYSDFMNGNEFEEALKKEYPQIQQLNVLVYCELSYNYSTDIVMVTMQSYHLKTGKKYRNSTPTYISSDLLVPKNIDSLIRKIEEITSEALTGTGSFCHYDEDRVKKEIRLWNDLDKFWKAEKYDEVKSLLYQSIEENYITFEKIIDFRQEPFLNHLYLYQLLSYFIKKRKDANQEKNWDNLDRLIVDKGCEYYNLLKKDYPDEDRQAIWNRIQEAADRINITPPCSID